MPVWPPGERECPNTYNGDTPTDSFVVWPTFVVWQWRAAVAELSGVARHERRRVCNLVSFGPTAEAQARCPRRAVYC